MKRAYRKVATRPAEGGWGLALDTRPMRTPGKHELVVFDVPAFTARFTAKAGSPENGFIDLAWAADSKSLHAIDGPADYAQGKPAVRRWAVPAAGSSSARRST